MSFFETKTHNIIAKRIQIRINDAIEADVVRVVDPGGKHGVYDLQDALDMADEQSMDLVEIAPNADPPVCKIMDYGKYLYEKNKKERDARKKQHHTQLKEIRFRPRTDTHDFQFKTKHAYEFLSDGHKVRAYVQFRGRDIIYKEQGMVILARFIDALKDVARLDQEPRMEGRRMTVTLAPLKTK